MRATTRLLASIAKKPSGQFLNSYTPTGLTGLLTHPFPRPTLIQLYNQTLTKLATLPTTSVYRQSVEALTKHRLAIVTAQIPEGYAEWEAEAIKLLEKHPELKESRSIKLVDGKAYPLPLEQEQEVDDRAMESEWNNDEEVEDRGEGPRTAKDRIFQASELGEGQRVQEFEKDLPTLPNEPALTVEQINTIETQVAAGLIEEVIEVAQAELELVDVMAENKVWEELEEKAADGQWSYFSRVKDVGVTSAPPTPGTKA